MTVSSTTDSSNSAASVLASQTASNASGSNTTANAASASSIQDTFLKMLVAQMNNQDPLNPLDNSEVTSQMAQISTVEGIQNLNSTMTAFSSAANTNTPVGLSSLIGDSVLSSGTAVTWGSNTTAVQAGFSLDQSASQVTVKLLDSQGNAVDTKTFTNVAAGTQGFSWTGQNADGIAYGAGNYTMSITASGSATATPLTLSTAIGSTQGASGPVVQLANGSAVSVSDIKGVFPPASTGSSSSATGSN